jgi:hypothetical protein
MKIGRVFPELLTPLSSAASIEEGLTRTIRRLVGLNRAFAGALVFRPPRRAAIVVTAGARRLPAALDAWLRDAVSVPPRSRRAVAATPPGAPTRPSLVLLRSRARSHAGSRVSSALPSSRYGGSIAVPSASPC